MAISVLKKMSRRKNMSDNALVIDKRHLWLSKKIANALQVDDVDHVEKQVSNPSTLKTVNMFFQANGYRTIFCCFNQHQNELMVTNELADLQSVQNEKVLYFLRNIEDNVAVSSECNKDISFGLFGSHSIKNLNVMIQEVYVPLLEANLLRGHRDNTDNFRNQLSRFSMSLLDLVQTIDSRVRLEKPGEELLSRLSTQLMDAPNNSEMKIQIQHRLQHLLGHWYNSAKKVLHYGQEDLNDDKESGPDSTLKFWRERLARLNALHEQLEADDSQKILKAFKDFDSEAGNKWDDLFVELRESIQESHENVRHLTSLNRNFEVLYSGNPAKIVEELPSMFSKIKMVRVMSKYLQSGQSMTALFVRVTNQMIRRCKEYIQMNGVLWKNDSKTIFHRIQECLNLNRHYQIQFRAAKREKAGAMKELPFSFNESLIFAKYERFALRLEKLLELFSIHDMFTFLSTQSLSGLGPVCDQYFAAVNIIKSRHVDLMDFFDQTFDRDFTYFKEIVEDLEEGLRGIIEDDFKEAETTEQSLEILSKHKALMRRQSLKPFLNQKLMEIFINFSQDLDIVTERYESQKYEPPMPRNFPPVTGRIVWARQMLKLIEIPMQKFQENNALMITKESKAIIRKYNKIAKVLMEYEIVLERSWLQSVETIHNCLQVAVIAYDESNGDCFANFDSNIFLVLREAKFMKMLGLKVPRDIHELIQREWFLKISLEKLQFALSDYRSLKKMISSIWSGIFYGHLSRIEQLLSRGKTEIKWTNLGLDSYILSIQDYLNYFMVVFRKAKDIYENRILRNLKFITTIQLVDMPKEITSVSAFITKEQEMIKERVNFIDQRCLEIEIAIFDILDMIRYTVQNDETFTKKSEQQFFEDVWEMAYHAILVCVKTSFHNLKTRIRGTLKDHVLGEMNPIFMVNLELIPPRLQITPDLATMQQAVNRIAMHMLKSIKISPWRIFLEKDAQRYSISTRILKSIEIVRLVLILTGSIERVNISIQRYLDSYHEFDYIWNKDKRSDLLEFLSTDPTVDDYIQRLHDFDLLIQRISNIQKASFFGPICVSNVKMIQKVVGIVRDWKFLYTKQLFLSAEEDFNVNMEWIIDMNSRLKTRIRDLDEVVLARDTLSEIHKVEADFEQVLISIDSRCRVAVEFGYISEKNLDLHTNIKNAWNELLVNARKTSDRLKHTQQNFKIDLRIAMNSFMNEIRALQQEYKAAGPSNKDLSPEVALERIARFQKQFDEKLKKLNSLHQGQELFGLEKTKFSEFEGIRKEFAKLCQFFALYSAGIDTVEGFKNLRWTKVSSRLGQVEERLKDIERDLHLHFPTFSDYRAFQNLESELQLTSQLLPLIKMLQTSFFLPRHWQQLTMRMNISLDFKSSNFIVKDVFETNILDYTNIVEDIYALAEQECSVEKQIKELYKLWEESSVPFEKSSNSNQVMIRVNAAQHLIEQFEEAIITLQSFMRKSKQFITEINDLMGKFSSFIDLVDSWLGIQHVWWNVKVAFSADGVKKQLPPEAKNFFPIDAAYLKIMDECFNLKYVPLINSRSEGFKSQFSSLKTEFESCQKFLAGYLNQKRQDFPRLYLLSDSLLLEGMSSIRDINNVQKGAVFTIFDNIALFHFSNSGLGDIVSIESREGEVLEFETQVSSKNSIETVLCHVEIAIKDCLKKLMKETMILDPEAFDWILDVPCQIGILWFQITWTSLVEAKVSSDLDGKGLGNTVSGYISKWQIGVSSLFQHDLTAAEYLKVQSTLTILFGLRDTTTELLNRKLRSSQEFDWQKQLKYRYAAEENQSYMEVMGRNMNYEYEFSGCKPRLVQHPNSNRFFTFAMYTFMNVNYVLVKGDIETEKNQTIHELSRMVGRFTVSFECLSDHNLNFLSNILNAVSKSTCWAYFKSMDRISPSLLSVLTTQLIQLVELQRAKPNCQHACLFASLDHSTTSAKYLRIFPSNLRSMFRTVSLQGIEIGTFVETKLRVAGFFYSKDIAMKFAYLEKLVQTMTFTINPAVLSLRKIAMIIDSSINEKGNNPDFDEFSSISNNIARVVSVQVSPEAFREFEIFLFEIFQRGAHDRSSQLTNNYFKASELEAVLLKTCEITELLPKTSQIYDYCDSHPQTMLLGSSGTGKTYSMNALISALASIDEKHKAVYLNPASLSNEIIFGRHKGGGEWAEGLFSLIVKKFLKYEDRNLWVIFDGPFNPEFFDHFANKHYVQISNGDIFPVKNDVRIIFETCDSEHLSPSVLSRLPLVYFGSNLITSKSLISLHFKKNDFIGFEKLLYYTEKIFLPCSEFFDRTSKSPQKLQQSIHCHIFCNLLLSVLKSLMKMGNNVTDAMIERIVVYSTLWTYLPISDDTDKMKLERKIRELCPISPSGRKGSTESTMLEFVLHEKPEHFATKWVPASQLVDADYFPYEYDTLQFDVLDVPTSESLAVSYVSSFLCHCGLAMVIAGPSRVGKSAIAERCLNFNSSLGKHVGSTRLCTTSNSTHLEDMLVLIHSKNSQKYRNLHESSLYFLIDDINIPRSDKFGQSASMECLKVLLERNGNYSYQKLGDFHDVTGTTFVATAMLLSHDCIIPPRLQKYCLQVILSEPSSEKFRMIFEHLCRKATQNKFSWIWDVKTAIHACAGAAAELLSSLRETMMSSQSSSYLRFDMSNGFKIFQRFLGIILRSDSVSVARDIASLFAYECSRELRDQMAERNRVIFDNFLDRAVALVLNSSRRSDSGRAEAIEHAYWLHNVKLSNDPSMTSHEWTVSAIENLIPASRDPQINRYVQDLFHAYKQACAQDSNEYLDLDFVDSFPKNLICIHRALTMDMGNLVVVGRPSIGIQLFVRMASFVVSAQIVNMQVKSEATALSVLMKMKAGVRMAGFLNKKIIFQITLDIDRHGITLVEDIFSKIKTVDFQSLFSDQEFETEFLSITKNHTDKSIIETKESFHHQVLRNVHFIIIIPNPLSKFSLVCESIPSSFTILLWDTGAKSPVEQYAKAITKELIFDIEAHAAESMVDVKQEVIKRIQEEENRSSNSNAIEIWDKVDIENAVQEAIDIQTESINNLKTRIKATIPKFMVEIHSIMIEHSQKLNDEFNLKSDFSMYNFQKFCKSFKQHYLQSYKKLYARQLMLKDAVQKLISCENDIEKSQMKNVHGNEILQSNTEDCEAIMKDIQMNTTLLARYQTEFENLETWSRSLNSELVQAKSKQDVYQRVHDELKEILLSQTESIDRDFLENLSNNDEVPLEVRQVFDLFLILFLRPLNKIEIFEQNGVLYRSANWRETVQVLKTPRRLLKTLKKIDIRGFNAEQHELISAYIESDSLLQQVQKSTYSSQLQPIWNLFQSLHARFQELNQNKIGHEQCLKKEKIYVSTNNQIAEIKDKISRAQEQIRILRQAYDVAVEKRQTMNYENERKQNDITTAVDLINGIRVQQKRWSLEISEHEFEIGKIAGDCCIAVAFQTYCSGFDAETRNEIFRRRLVNVCKDLGISITLPVNPLNGLVTDHDILQWRRQGLYPEDSCSDGIFFIWRSKLWPLFYDPCDVVTGWIRGVSEATAGELKLFHARDDNLLVKTKECMKFGIPALIQDFDPETAQEFQSVTYENFIHSVQETTDSGPQPTFFVYMRTSEFDFQRYSEEFLSTITVVNCAPSERMLEMKILSSVLLIEDSYIEKERMSTLSKELQVNLQVKDIHQSLLKSLCTMQGNIWDSHQKLQEIQSLKFDLQNTIKERNELKRKWSAVSSNTEPHLPVVNLAKQVIKALSYMKKLDSLYFISFQRFVHILGSIINSFKTLMELPKHSEVNKISFFEFEMYRTFGETYEPSHKYVWLLLFAMFNDSELENHHAFYVELIGSKPLDATSKHQNELQLERLKNLQIFSVEQVSGMLHLMESSQTFKTVLEDIETNETDWVKWLQSDTPEMLISSNHRIKMIRFEKLLLVRFLRFDRFQQAVSKYCKAVVHFDIDQPIVLDPESCYKMSNIQMPVLLLIDEGSNTWSLLHNMARRKKIPIRTVSMGEGQRDIAQKYLISGPSSGIWLILENVNHDITFLHSIPSIIQKSESSADTFRLFITCPLKVNLPRNLVEISLVKCAIEPRSFKEKLYATITWVSQELLDIDKEMELKYVLLSTCILHAIARVRSKYRAIGWCSAYSLNQSDFTSSILQINQIVLDSIEHNMHGRRMIPWSLLKSFILELLFGAEVVGATDRTMMEIIASRCLSSRIFLPEFEFAPILSLSQGQDAAAILQSFRAVTGYDDMSVIDVESWAENEFCSNSSKELVANLQDLLSIEQRGQPSYEDDSMLPQLEFLEDKLFFQNWNNFDFDRYLQHFESKQKSLKAIIMQERFIINQMFERLDVQITALKQKIATGSKLSAHDREVVKLIQRGKMPWGNPWQIESIAKLSAHLNHHTEQMIELTKRKHFGRIWISGFSNPTSVVMHAFFEVCKRKNLSFDSSSICFEFSWEHLSVQDDIIIDGLMIQGASWNSRAGKLVKKESEDVLESIPSVLLAVETKSSWEGMMFATPCYVCPSRKDDNLLFSVYLPTDLPPQRLQLSSCSLFLRD